MFLLLVRLGFDLLAAHRLLQLFHCLVDREGRWALAWREVLERLEELAGQRAAREQDVALLQFPTVVGVGGDVGLLVGVGVQVVHLREPQRRERLAPHGERAGDTLFQEDDFPILDPHGDDVAVVVEVEEPAPRAFLDLAGQIGKLVVAVDVDLVDLAADVHALEEFVLHIGISGRSDERREPVVTADDLVGDRTGLDVARPADHAWNTERAFPVGGFLVAERRDAAVGPTVFVRTVVSGVEDDGVVSDASVIQSLEDLADDSVVLDHAVVVFGTRSETGLVAMLRLHVREGVHARGVHPTKERLVGLGLSLDEIDRSIGSFVVDRLHAFSGQRAGVLNGLLAYAAPARLLGGIILVGSLTAEHAARAEHLLEFRILRIRPPLRLLLGVEVVEIAEELVEAVHGGQRFIGIAKVVFAKLRGGIALRLE